MKKSFFFAFALALLAGCLLASCSNGSDSQPIVIIMPSETNGGGTTTTTTSSGTETTQTPTTTTTTPEPADTTTTPTSQTPTTYTITFNANDGSENPSTATQTFTAGTPQNLKTIAALGFKKGGFNFAGWLATADATEASYADGAAYIFTADITLYAKWSAVSTATYTITFNANDGSENPVTATQTFTAGTTQALKTIAELGFKKDGFNFAGWLTAADATETTYADGASYAFTTDTTLYAKWSVASTVSYTVTITSGIENGTVRSNLANAIAGATVTLTIRPAAGFKLETFAVTAATGSTVTTSVTGNTRIFTMPAFNVTVTATFVSHTPANGAYTKVDTVTIDGINYDLVTFGLWPQTIKDADITVDESVKETHGAFTFCKGDDGEWYVMQAEQACFGGQNYSDGTAVGCRPGQAQSGSRWSL